MASEHRALARRIAGSAALLAAAALFLAFRAPIPEARADIYVPLATHAGLLDPAADRARPRPVVVNGQRFSYRVWRSEEPPREALARLARGGKAVFESLDAGGGVLVRARPEAPLIDALTGRLEVFLALSEKPTLMLRFAPEEPLDFVSMFPEQGDAPGRDASGVPRPPGGRRVLTVEQPFAQSVVSFYEVPVGEAPVALAQVASGLIRAGWSGADGPHGVSGTRFFVKDAEDCLLAAVEGDGRSMVAVVHRAAAAGADNRGGS